MTRGLSRQNDAARVFFYPGHPGSRAVFLAEVRSRKEARQVRDIFDMVGQLAEVVPISSGPVMSYAVQLHGDTSLFAKVECLLKTQLPFSLVERNFSDVTFHLVQTLCEDTNGEVAELPECGVCGAADPFPTRATVEWADPAQKPLHLAYCAKCSAEFAEEDAAAHAHALIRNDADEIRISRRTPVILMPDMADEHAEPDFEFLAATG